MLSIFTLTLLAGLATCSARPQAVPLRSSVPYAISRTQITDDAGQFTLSYTNSDGLSVTDLGVLKSINGNDKVLVRQGSYRYVSPEGVPIEIFFVADHLGYRAYGTTVPSVPAVPVAPVRVI